MSCQRRPRTLQRSDFASMAFLPPQYIRPIAVCVIWRGDSIFVSEGRDRVKNQTFYRPLGGAIEFGELGADAITREIREELGAELTRVKFLGALENIFTLEGVAGHEIVLVFEGRFADDALYGIDETTGFEGVGASFKALWKPLSDFEDGAAPLYPEGLLELLSKQ